MSLQEKSQVILPPKPNEDDGTEWKTFESQRQTVAKSFSNEMPNGMNLENENMMRLGIAGSTDSSADVTQSAFSKGYTRCEMAGSDDQCAGEQACHFYGEAVDENGKTGFAERNNYLDRI